MQSHFMGSGKKYLLTVCLYFTIFPGIWLHHQYGFNTYSAKSFCMSGHNSPKLEGHFPGSNMLQSVGSDFDLKSAWKWTEIKNNGKKNYSKIYTMKDHSNNTNLKNLQLCKKKNKHSDKLLCNSYLMFFCKFIFCVKCCIGVFTCLRPLFLLIVNVKLVPNIILLTFNFSI